MQFPSFKNELEQIRAGFTWVVGCDEVGVAPLAGPVVAAACILDPLSIGKYRSKNKWYARVRDSKTTTGEEREELRKEILKHTLAHGLGVVWQEEIDSLNIHHASLLAMRRAVEDLLGSVEDKSKKVFVFVDGRFKIPQLELDQKAVIDGDALIISISAASIIAKVHRDDIMHRLDHYFPEYGFKKHKGYPTAEHRRAINKYGITEMHRKSFVGKML